MATANPQAKQEESGSQSSARDGSDVVNSKVKRRGSTVTVAPSTMDKLPTWVSANLRSKKSWKLLARCWLAAWAAFVIILPQRSLVTLGNAAFFALLTSLMIPPNMPVQMFLFASLTMLIGMCAGWGIGAAGMKAALTARNQVVLKQTLLRAQQSAAGAVNPDAQFRLSIFQGVFLDTRSTIIFGVFLGVGSFLFALLRAYAPKLTLMSVFGTVVLDIVCSYGPLFPVAQYTLPSSLVISVATYIAIAIVVITFVFPESMNYAYLSSASALLGDLKKYIECQADILECTPEEITSDERGLLAKCIGIRAGLIAAQQGLEAKSALINVEFSYGKWNGDDAKALEKPLRIVVTRIASLQSFSNHVRRAQEKTTDISRTTTVSGDSDASSDSHMTGDTELIRQLHTEHRAHELTYGVGIGDLIPLLRDATLDLRKACVEGLNVAQVAVDDVNTTRWKRATSGVDQVEERLDKAVEDLRNQTASFKSSKRLALISPYIPLLNTLSPTSRNLPLRSLIITYVFCASLVVSADSIVALLETINQAYRKRRKSRLWAPSKMRAIAKFVMRKGDSDGGQLLGEASRVEEEEGEKEDERGYRRDPDSRPPTNVVQKTVDALHRAYLWLKTPEAVFAVKYVIVTIALWLPQVLRQTAYFFYVEKGVWALIMAQTTLNIYISDQIYNYVARILGTVAGLLAGLAAWYIGNGRGNGSPVGSAASLGVFLVPIIFTRIFAPPALMVPNIMFTVTLALIMGYSWIDGHLTVFGSPGIGLPVAWRRFVLVMIGCAASFVLMMFPPSSGRKAVRLRNASIITELSSLYSFLISTWIVDTEEHTRVSESEKTKNDEQWLPKWTEEFRERIVPLGVQIQALRMQTVLAKWEGNLRGKWPSEDYGRLVDVESDLLVGLLQLSGALGHLDTKWRLSLTHRTKILNPKFISDVMSIFALVSQSLRTGEPMHQVLPTALFERLLYHDKNASSFEPASADGSQPPVDSETVVEKIQSLEYMYYAAGIASVSQVITGLDELHKITKELCGEVPFKGFDEWRSTYGQHGGSV